MVSPSIAEMQPHPDQLSCSHPSEHNEHNLKIDSKCFAQKVRLGLERLQESLKKDMDQLVDDLCIELQAASSSMKCPSTLSTRRPSVPLPGGEPPDLNSPPKGLSRQRTQASEGPSKASEPGSFLRSAVSTQSLSPSGRKRHLNLIGADFQQDMQFAAIAPIMNSADDLRSVVPLEGGSQQEFLQLPNSVAGAWRRQACILAKHFREEMADELAMAKMSISFRGGLWWLRHAVGLRSLAAPGKAAAISAFNSLVIVLLLSFAVVTNVMNRGTVVGLINDIIVVFFGVAGLLVHHIYYRFSDSTPPTSEQDSMLQAHSVAFGCTGAWLVQSRQHGKQLLMLWLVSICACMASNHSDLYNMPESALTSIATFVVSSGIVCA
eukprot:TRINITY_DN20790_c0_g1_i1.p1 TRINITY_DN20790_c0_g1~~TRINITY_DN20790_c0_g1_i1.p1  ORF type:complete len:379 (+),score=37.83 TRINITY_DN20790_c0_g1_i1:52-1188(+)